MTQILLVEDDAKLVDLVTEYLTGHGFEVDVERRGDTAVQRILGDEPALVLLDLMLPGLDGMEVCRQVRRSGFAGAVIMMTARGDAIDEILGLEVGADDYLTKPVRPRVLLAHVQAVLRRTQGARAEVKAGRLVLDLPSRVASLDGEPLELTTGEFDLLAVFVQNAGRVLSRDDLSMALRGVPWNGMDRSIDLRVSRLRKKLDDDGEVIKSVRGSGYLMVPDV